MSRHNKVYYWVGWLTSEAVPLKAGLASAPYAGMAPLTGVFPFFSSSTSHQNGLIDEGRRRHWTLAENLIRMPVMKKLFVSAGIFAAAVTVIFSLSLNGVAQEQPNAVKPSTQPKTGLSEYIVIRTDPSIFTETVNVKLKEGFLLQGGITVISISGGESYAQAMVR